MQGDVVEEHRVDKRSPSTKGKMLNFILDGTERCCWRECGLLFASVDDLMNHLMNDHIGSGKNYYECFWSN